MNDNVEIIRSNKGGLKLIHRGYMYTVHKKRQGGGIRWRCTQRSWHCKGSISTGNGPPTVNMPHNHIPDPHSVALARCRQIQDFPDLTSMLETEYDETKDTISLQQRIMSFNSPQVQIPLDSPLQTQPVSPTKLRVTRSNKPASSRSSSEQRAVLPVDEVCLRWNSHHSNMQNSFPRLLNKEQYVDVTLIAEGKSLKCHRIILSSCSTYFEEVLSDITPSQHPVIILKSTPFWILRALIDFMYAGEVNIDQNMLPELLDTAEFLKIKGLAGKSAEPDRDIKQEIPEKMEEKIAGTTSTEDMNINDPLELLQPKFLDDSKKDKIFPKKILGKKIRKRKSSEDECSSPPLFPMRRGTRSRPNVKVPRYYDYEDIVKPTSSDQPLSPDITIKTEPPDVDDENDSQSGFPNSNNSSIEVSKTKAEIRAVKEKSATEELKPEQLYKIKIKCLASLSEKPVQNPSPTPQLHQENEKIEEPTIDVTGVDPKKADIPNALEIIKIDVNVNKEKSVEEPINDVPQVEIIATDTPLTENERNLETK